MHMFYVIEKILFVTWKKDGLKIGFLQWKTTKVLTFNSISETVINTWWILSTLLALCEENPQATSEFPHKGPAMWGFDVSLLLA